jgi:hypothetical protein
MAKKKRLSRDQKRKAKLSERARRRPEKIPLAYEGDKYKKDEYVNVFLHTELGIHEVDVVLGRKMPDRVAQSALEKLVGRLRQGPLPAVDDLGRAPEFPAGQEDEMIVWSIRRKWELLKETEPLPDRETLVGILRTILNSMETWGGRGAHSRGYLSYIEGFLAQAGARVEVLDAEDEGEEEDELYATGRDWCEGVHGAEQEFRRLADQMIRTGEADHVQEVCQRLMGEEVDSPVVRELSLIAVRAFHRDNPR